MLTKKSEQKNKKEGKIVKMNIQELEGKRIAVLLSGGVDSSVVVYEFARLGLHPDCFYIKIGPEEKEDWDCNSEEDLEMAIAASNILFGKATKESLEQLDEATLNDVFKDVPHYEIDRNQLGLPAIDLFNQDGMDIFPSKSEMRKLVKGGGVSLNKEKLETFDRIISADDLIDNKYLLLQRGKKNYYLLSVK